MKNSSKRGDRQFLKGLSALANSDGTEADARFLRRRFPKLFDGESVDWLRSRRAALREIWERGPLANQQLFLLMNLIEPVGDMHGVPLPGLAGTLMFVQGHLEHLRCVPDWNRGGIVYQPQNEFERGLYALLRNHSLAKKCTNPDCPAPYFVATRANRRVCFGDCASEKQRAYKRRWWKEQGDQWRRKRAKGKRKRSK